MIELIVGIVVLGLIAAVFILPVVALVRTREIGKLAERVADLEADLDALRRQVRELRRAAPAPAEDLAPVEAVAAPAAAPPPLPPPAARPARPRPAAAADLES